MLQKSFSRDIALFVVTALVVIGIIGIVEMPDEVFNTLMNLRVK